MINSTVGRNLIKILLFFNILLAGFGAWLVFDVVSFWVSPPDVGTGSPAKSQGKVASAQGTLVAPRSLADYERLSKADIFRISPPSNPSEGRTQLEGPKGTSPDLKLKGTILGNNGQSYAVIEDGKTKTQLLYSMNELVLGARIIAIEPDHVVLSVQGKDEVLVMSEKGEPETTSVSASPRPLPPGARVGRGNRESRQLAIKPEPVGRTAQRTDQDSALTRDQQSPPGGEQAGEEDSQSGALTQGKPEDQPSK